MKICWVYDDEDEYFGCRLFKNQAKAIKTIDEFMENKGYKELTRGIPHVDGHHAKIYINSENIKSTWFFLWVEVE